MSMNKGGVILKGIDTKEKKRKAEGNGYITKDACIRDIQYNTIRRRHRRYHRRRKCYPDPPSLTGIFLRHTRVCKGVRISVFTAALDLR